MKLKAIALKILLGLILVLSLLYAVLHVQGSSPIESDVTALPSVSPTATIPINYEQERAAAAEYWLRNVHRLPIPPSSSPGTPYPTSTVEPYPVSTVEPTVSMPTVAVIDSPNIIKTPSSSSTPLEDRINDSAASVSRIHLPLVLTRINEIQVFVIAYMNQPIGRAEFPQLLDDIMADLTKGSRWHGTGVPTVKFIVSDLVTTTTSSPMNGSGNLSFLAVFNAHGLCDKIRSGEIDQVWLFNPGDVPNPVEFAVNGDDYGIWNQFVDMPNCGKARPMFTFVYANYYPSLGAYYPAYPHQAVHSFSHYIETLFWMRKQEDRLYCDFIAANGRIASYQELGGTRVYYEFPTECSGAYARSDKYGFTSLALSSVGLTSSVVGDVHFPPNISAATEANEYKYDRTNVIQSISEMWKWGQPPPTSGVSCLTWKGCTNGNPTYCPVNNSVCAQRRYLVWWLQHIPSKFNDSTGRNGLVRESWWTYLLQ